MGMELARHWFLSSISILFFLSRLNCLERDFTINVEPGREECFYQTVKKTEILDVEYQVIDGGHGDLDINFQIVSPSGRIIVSTFRKADNVHRQTANEDGDYKICFDNTFSRISTKVVYFEIIVEAEDEDEEDSWDLEGILPKGITPEDVYDIKIEEIEEAVGRVKSSLSKIRHVQDQLRTFEARDRNIQEHNFSRVNTWSVLQISVMIVVGLIQVVMVRSLFDDKSKVHQIWKMKS